jgi:OOP family OmpA-OmpF porin
MQEPLMDFSYSRRRALLVALPLLFCSLSTFAAGKSSPLFAEQFSGTVPVVDELSQIIYYREPSSSAHSEAANIYIDKQLHTALLPGGYTIFCLKPGPHTLGAYFRKGTHYPGKTRDLYAAQLRGGKTYFLRVSEMGELRPQPVKRAVAEKNLRGLYRQVHMFNRATSMEPCAWDPAREQQTREYAIDTAVLFGSDDLEVHQLTAAGRHAVAELALALRQDLSRINRVNVSSQTHDAKGNMIPPRLRQQRAELLRDQLVNNAIPARLITIADTTPAPALCTENCASSRQQIRVYAN